MLGLNPPRNENDYSNVTPGRPMHNGTRTRRPSESIAPILQSAAENDQVRVLEYRLKAREKEPMHSHPAGVVYVLGGAKLKFSYPDGRTEERGAATGETIWRDPTTHAVENVGDTEAHAIAIDVKTPGQH
jgi:quercetin dioxygenase-like cupin family protein